MVNMLGKSKWYDFSLQEIFYTAGLPPTPFRKKSFSPAEKIRIWHCAALLFLQVSKKCMDLDLGLLYILPFGIYSKFTWKNNFLAFALRSPARALAAGLPRQDHVYSTTDESFRFHNKNFDEKRCKLDSTENLRSFEKYPIPP